MANIKEEAIDNVLKTSNSEKLFIKAFSAYQISRKNCIEKIVIFMICSVISVMFGFSSDTVPLITNSVSILLNVLLAFFGIIFTGYAIFQALLNNRLIISLFEHTVTEKNITKSKLQEINENFVHLMMLFIFGILINMVLCFVMPVIPVDYCLLGSLILCNIIASVVMNILLYAMGVIIWRMVSFIGNIFHLFNAYSVAKLMDVLQEDERDTV